MNNIVEQINKNFDKLLSESELGFFCTVPFYIFYCIIIIVFPLLIVFYLLRMYCIKNNYTYFLKILEIIIITVILLIYYHFTFIKKLKY